MEFKLAIGKTGVISKRERTVLIGKDRRKGYLSEGEGNALVLFDTEADKPLMVEDVSIVLIPARGNEDDLAHLCAWGDASGYLTALDIPIEEIYAVLMQLPDSQLDYVQGEVMSDFVSDPDRDYWDTFRAAIAKSFHFRDEMASIKVRPQKGPWKRRK